jgi:hypothetical protein
MFVFIRVGSRLNPEPYSRVAQALIKQRRVPLPTTRLSYLKTKRSAWALVGSPKIILEAASFLYG